MPRWTREDESADSVAHQPNHEPSNNHMTRVITQQGREDRSGSV
ncbi:MAG: hypothetical protein RLZZ165_1203 [Bacteroidota bacterium]